jgi:hypothetical protein
MPDIFFLTSGDQMTEQRAADGFARTSRKRLRTG